MERVEVKPEDYDEIKEHLHYYEEECSRLRNMPPKVVTKVETK